MSPPQFKLPVGQERVRLLYEEYVHLPQLREVWASPVTEKPDLEPCFAAALHGIELCFLLMAEFLSDTRTYVAKRPRIELMANDIRHQCQLLAELVDGELEEEGLDEADDSRDVNAHDVPDNVVGNGELDVHRRGSKLTLTQGFPFDSAPPTRVGPGHSPGLHRLVDAATAACAHLRPAERNSLVKVVLNITSAFDSSFERWTVGLGIEHQLAQLREAVGLPHLSKPPHQRHLDYNLLVRPEVVEATLLAEPYANAEDFFFRTIHLGTECWCFIALRWLRSAAELAAVGRWHVASARICLAAQILGYMGDHILSLTSMNLRDYLMLKVELEGTSGAGSVQVKNIKTQVLQLLEPFAAAAQRNTAVDFSADNAGMQPLHAAVMRVYENPHQTPGLYCYAKALEGVEAALQGGFYYKHYILATTVIGSEARGTMRMAVAALKRTYETALFPVLDEVRVALGKKFDAQLAHIKGRMMDEIMARWAAEAPAAATAAATALAPLPTHQDANSNDPVSAVPASADGSSLAATTALASEAGQHPALLQQLSQGLHTQGSISNAVSIELDQANSMSQGLGAAAAAAAAAAAGCISRRSASGDSGTAAAAAATAAAAAAAHVVTNLPQLYPGAAAALAADAAEDALDEALIRASSGQPSLTINITPRAGAGVGSPDGCPFHSRNVEPSDVSCSSTGHQKTSAQCSTLGAIQEAQTGAGIEAAHTSESMLGGRAVDEVPSCLGPSPIKHNSRHAPSLPADQSTPIANAGFAASLNLAGNTAVQSAARNSTNDIAAQGSIGHSIPALNNPCGTKFMVTHETLSVSAESISRVEAKRRWLYSTDGVPPDLLAWIGQAAQRLLPQVGLPPAPITLSAQSQPHSHGCPAGLMHAKMSAVAACASQAAEQECVQQHAASLPLLAFLDHAWGQQSPRVLLAATQQALAMQLHLGNLAWDVLYGDVMPLAGQHVRSLLALPQDDNVVTVQWGHCSHELVTKLISCFLDRPAGTPLRILTSDTEFYSITRQLNRFATALGVNLQVTVVEAKPAATFAQRTLARAAAAVAAAPADGGFAYDMVYISQVTYLTQACLLPDIAAFVEQLSDLLHAPGTNPTTSSSSAAAAAPAATALVPLASSALQQPFIVIDGYHTFGALPVDLSRVATKCLYIAGLLKHVGCGPNAAFLTLPSHLGIRPVLTGWLADPSVLSAGSAGIGLGSEVGYCPPLALQGGTPSFLLPLLTFTMLIDAWAEGPNGTNGSAIVPADAAALTSAGHTAGDGCTVATDGKCSLALSWPEAITVDAIHQHVLTLHTRFLAGIAALSPNHRHIKPSACMNAQPGHCQSHTLVFECCNAGAAKEVVENLKAKHAIVVDCRKQYVRLGFGFNHDEHDVDRLLLALSD